MLTVVQTPNYRLKNYKKGTSDFSVDDNYLTNCFKITTVFE